MKSLAYLNINNTKTFYKNHEFIIMNLWNSGVDLKNAHKVF